MNNPVNKETKALLDRGFISLTQYEQISEYRSRNVFSLLNELRGLLYISVLLFTSGLGILIYKNIDSIGHMAILTVILLLTIVCFYFSFKNSKGFSRGAVVSEKPLFDYLVLLANLLAGIFMGYLQYQYHPFGAYNNIATLLPTLLYFFSAYYFDHKGVLSLAITGLAAFIGLSVSPQGLLENDFERNPLLTYYAIVLGAVLTGWAALAKKTDLKKHFNITYLNFAIHMLCIACLSNFFSPGWLVFLLLLAGTVYYFIRLAYAQHSVNFLFFAVVYGYIGLNISLVKLMDASGFFTAMAFLGPFYFGASVFFFIRWIKNFKKRTSNASV